MGISITFKDKSRDYLPSIEHWASFGYIHVPKPLKLLQSVSLKVPDWHVSGQQRNMSLP